MNASPSILALVTSIMLLAVAPAASATHACGESAVLTSTDAVAVALIGGDCVGVAVGFGFPSCHEAIWGVYGDTFGVGGHNGCEVMAYAGPFVRPALLP